jgi:hypothetical protein
MRVAGDEFDHETTIAARSRIYRWPERRSPVTLLIIITSYSLGLRHDGWGYDGAIACPASSYDGHWRIRGAGRERAAGGRTSNRRTSNRRTSQRRTPRGSVCAEAKERNPGRNTGRGSAARCPGHRTRLERQSAVGDPARAIDRKPRPSAVCQDTTPAAGRGRCQAGSHADDVSTEADRTRET